MSFVVTLWYFHCKELQLEQKEANVLNNELQNSLYGWTPVPGWLKQKRLDFSNFPSLDVS